MKTAEVNPVRLAEIRLGARLRGGFTLVEILVSIAIIGFLSSIVIGSLNDSRSKARDAVRLSHISQIQRALEQYYSDNGRYPPGYGAVAPNTAWATSNHSTSWGALEAALAPYIGKLPHDPLERPAADANSWPAPASGGVWSGYYAYSYYGYRLNPQNGGCVPDQAYVIVYRLENAVGPDPGFRWCNGTLWQYGGTGANTYSKTIGNKVQ